MRRTQVLGLYRQILRTAVHFPSVKKNRIVAEIKLEFRENRSLTHELQQQEKLALALDGLAKLQQYAPMKASNRNWSLDLAQFATKGTGISGKM